MRGQDYEVQIDTLKQDLLQVRQRMDSAHKSWMKSISEAIVSWYELTMRETIRGQYRHALALGSTGMLSLKEQFVAFVQTTPTLVNAQLSSPQFWSHKYELGPIPGPLAKEDAYSLSQPWILSYLRDNMIPLFERMGTLLVAHGFSVPNTAIEANEPRTDLTLAKEICSSPKAISDLATYAGLHAEAVVMMRRLEALQSEWAEALAREKESQEKQRVEQERASALELWDNAFTLNRGQSIDWNKAWESADSYQHDRDEWGDRYIEWLAEEASKAGAAYLDWLAQEGENPGCADFEAFLVATKNVASFEQETKRIWRTGLLKAVLRQLGKSTAETWIQQLVDEQVAKRSAAAEYYSYVSLLYFYLENSCSECGFYSADDPCSVCHNCHDCCECGTRYHDAEEGDECK